MSVSIVVMEEFSLGIADGSLLIEEIVILLLESETFCKLIKMTFDHIHFRLKLTSG